MTLSSLKPGFYACWILPPTSKGFFINHIMSSSTGYCIYDSYGGPTHYLKTFKYSGSSIFKKTNTTEILCINPIPTITKRILNGNYT